MKKFLSYSGLVIIIVVVVIVGLRFISGEEDTWICDNGEWVKHGVPSAEKPTTFCPGAVTNTENENNNFQINTNTTDRSE